jgi:hypothetical protein
MMITLVGLLGITLSHCYDDHISRVIRNNTVTLL